MAISSSPFNSPGHLSKPNDHSFLFLSCKTAKEEKDSSCLQATAVRSYRRKLPCMAVPRAHARNVATDLINSCKQLPQAHARESMAHCFCMVCVVPVLSSHAVPAPARHSQFEPLKRVPGSRVTVPRSLSTGSTSPDRSHPTPSSSR